MFFNVGQDGFRQRSRRPMIMIPGEVPDSLENLVGMYPR